MWVEGGVRVGGGWGVSECRVRSIWVEGGESVGEGWAVC